MTITKISIIPTWFKNRPRRRQAMFPNFFPEFQIASNKILRWDAEDYVEWDKNVSSFGWNKVNNVAAGGIKNNATYVFFQYDGPFYTIAANNGFTLPDGRGDIYAHFDSVSGDAAVKAVADQYIHLFTSHGSDEVVVNGEFPGIGGASYSPYSVTQKITRGFALSIQAFNAANNRNIKIGWWAKGKYAEQLPLFWEHLPDNVAIQRYKNNYAAITEGNKTYYFSDSAWHDWLIGEEIDYMGHSSHYQAGLYSLCQFHEPVIRAGDTVERQHIASRSAIREQPTAFNEQNSIRLYRYQDSSQYPNNDPKYPNKFGQPNIADNIDNKTMRECFDNFNTGMACASIFVGTEYWGFGTYTFDRNATAPYTYPSWVDWFTVQTDWFVLGMYFASHALVKPIIAIDHIWELPHYSFDGVEGMTVIGDNVYPAKGRLGNIKPNGLPIVRYKLSADGTQAAVYVCYPKNPNPNTVDVNITIPDLGNAVFQVRAGWAELYHITL